MRTCTGCRQVAPQRDLVRIAMTAAGAVMDRERRLPGRGAYVHPVSKCVTPHGLSRGLRKGVSTGQATQIASDLRAGVAGANAVETPPRSIDDARV